MSKFDKEIEKLRNSKSEADFELIDKILKSLGYTHRQGKHNIYTNDNCENIVIPTVSGRFVKRRYVNMVLDEYDNK